MDERKGEKKINIKEILMLGEENGMRKKELGGKKKEKARKIEKLRREEHLQSFERKGDGVFLMKL